MIHVEFLHGRLHGLTRSSKSVLLIKHNKLESWLEKLIKNDTCINSLRKAHKTIEILWNRKINSEGWGISTNNGCVCVGRGGWIPSLLDRFQEMFL